MAKVYGKITLNILVDDVEDSEELGLLQANYKINPELMVGWKLSGIDSSGNERKINVCDCVNVNLNEFLG